MLTIYPIYENTYAKEFVKLFTDTNNNLPKILFGTNSLAEDFSKYLSIDGFINTFSNEKEFCDKPIFHKIDEVPENALVINCVYLGSIINVTKLLAKYRFRSLDCYSFLKYSKLPINLQHFTGWAEDINDHFEKYNLIFEKLEDEESKNVFQNLINFKISGNIKYLLGFQMCYDKQYFDECVKLSEEAVFVDVGGFDGLTTKTFIEHCPNYKKIYFFEPETHNMELAIKNLAQYSNINFIQKGLYNSNGVLNFKINGNGSAISENGDHQIEVTRLDDTISEEVNFIKMDIEGSELYAIEGAAKTIKKYRPILAICVYHLPDDFWKIPEKVLSIQPDYHVYIRHYSTAIVETVMYFI